MQVRETLAANPVFGALRQMATGYGLAELDTELRAVEALTGEDLARCAEELLQVESNESLVRRSGSHLLALGGKRLRPLCVMLGARLGTGFGPQVLDLA